MISDGKIERLEKRLDAVVPQTAEDVDARLRERAPIVYKTLEAFPGLWVKVVDAVRQELLMPHPWNQSQDEYLASAPAVWEALGEYPEATRALLEALKAAAAAEARA